MTTDEEVRRTRLPHMPALDGLRGVAVLAVLLFHGGLTWARGGYLGVTTFFVLSGFLITSLLLVEREDRGAIDLRAFWARRARRLAPALVLLVALVALYLLAASPGRQPGVIGDAVATLTWVANWRFVFAHRSYGDLFSQPSPFQHAWSLGVEEQFYLVLPLVAVLLLRARRGGPARRSRLGAFALLGIAASTALAAALHHPGIAGGHAYYGTDARLAEPLTGVLLALLLTSSRGPAELRGHGRAAVSLAGVAGLAMLAVMMATVGERSDALYRGGFLAAAAASAACVAAATQPRSAVARLLATRPLTALGRISYGVYLFHWPIFLWVTGRRTGLSPIPLLLARALITVGLATVSYAVVEHPIRAGRVRLRWVAVGWVNASVAALAGLVAATAALPPTTQLMAGLGGPAAPPPMVTSAGPSGAPAGAAAALVGAGTGARASAAAGPPASATRARTGSPSAASTPTTARPANRTHGSGAGNLASGSSQPAPDPPATAPGSSGPPPLKVAVVGDSMAGSLASGLNTWANRRGDVVVYDLSTAGCPLSRGGDRRLPDGSDFEVRPECAWWNDPSSDRSVKLRQFAPDIVVVQDGMNEVPDRKLPSWPTYRRPGDPTFDSWLLNEYNAAVKVFTGNQAKVLFLNTVCADWETMGGAWADYETNGDGDARVAALGRTDQAVTVAGVQVEDFMGHLCPNGKFTQNVDGVSDARPDGYHLSNAASAAVAEKWLGPLILQSGPRTPL